MKKILAILSVFLMISISLTGCGKYDTPEKALKTTMDKIISGKTDTLSEIFEASDSSDSQSSSDTEDAYGTYAEALYKSMTYKIVKTDEKTDMATVTIEVNSIDMAKIMNDYINKYLDFSDSINTEESDKWIEEQVTAEDAQRITIVADVPMIKTNGKWSVDPYGDLDRFTNAMSGGLVDALSGNDSSLNDSEE